MEDYIDASGRAYVRKAEIARLYSDVKALQRHLICRKGGVALDLTWELRSWLSKVVLVCTRLPEDAARVPSGIRDDMMLFTQENFKLLPKMHLLKKPCERAGVDYDAFVAHFNDVRTLFD